MHEAGRHGTARHTRLLGPAASCSRTSGKTVSRWRRRPKYPSTSTSPVIVDRGVATKHERDIRTSWESTLYRVPLTWQQNGETFHPHLSSPPLLFFTPFHFEKMFEIIPLDHIFPTFSKIKQKSEICDMTLCWVSSVIWLIASPLVSQILLSK